jgi:hypothetical protein
MRDSIPLVFTCGDANALPLNTLRSEKGRR